MTRLRALSFLVLLLATGLLSACEEAVNPFLESDRYFSVYGYLDTDQDTQYLRVIPLRRLVEPPPPGPLAATVVTTDLVTGERHTWRDSLVTFRDGTSGNVFVGEFTPAYGHRYRLDVTDAEGRTTSAETTVPPYRRPFIGEVYGGTTFANVAQDLVWPDVDYVPVRLQVWYRFAPNGPDAPFVDVPIEYSDAELGRLEGGDWRTTAFLLRDTQKVGEVLGRADLPTLYNVGMKISVTSDDWRPPGGVFDPEVLIQPGTFTNVDNGFGFFGSVAQLDAEWTLTRETYAKLGYPYPAP